MGDAAPSPFPLADGMDAPYTTPVPDIVIDHWMAHLSGAEVKVLLYVIRRTFGFKKSSDNISLNQIAGGIHTRAGAVLDEGTGLSQKTVLAALQSLEEKRVILALRRSSPTKGHLPTTYRLNVRDPFPQNVRSHVPKIPEGLPTKDRTQETVVQETDLFSKRGRTRATSTPRPRQRDSERYTGGRYPICGACGIDPCECTGCGDSPIARKEG